MAAMPYSFDLHGSEQSINDIDALHEMVDSMQEELESVKKERDNIKLSNIHNIIWNLVKNTDNESELLNQIKEASQQIKLGKIDRSKFDFLSPSDKENLLSVAFRNNFSTTSLVALSKITTKRINLDYLKPYLDKKYDHTIAEKLFDFSIHYEQASPGSSWGIKVGDRVERGPDWAWNNQDGGKGKLGTVIKIGDWSGKPGTGVRVHWDNGHKNIYRWNYSGKVDLKVHSKDNINIIKYLDLGNQKINQILLSQRSILSFRSSDHENALMIYAKYGSNPEALEALFKKFDPREINNKQLTAFELAMFHNSDQNMVNKIIELECIENLERPLPSIQFRPENKNISGHTPLTYAVKLRRTALAKSLLAKGVSPNTKNLMGYSPYHYANSNMRNILKFSQLRG